LSIDATLTSLLSGKSTSQGIIKKEEKKVKSIKEIHIIMK
jgi:hypothetical protein